LAGKKAKLTFPYEDSGLQLHENWAKSGKKPFFSGFLLSADSRGGGMGSWDFEAAP